jgi:hypothetical protein
LGSKTNHSHIPFGYLPHLLVQGHQGPPVFSGALIAEAVDGVRDKGSGDSTTVDVQTLKEAFLNISLRSACFIDEAFFSGKRY